MNRTKKMASRGIVSLIVSQGRNCVGTCAVRVVKIVSFGRGYSLGGTALYAEGVREWTDLHRCQMDRS